MKKMRIGFIGGGSMGSAIIKGLITSGMPASQFTVCDMSEARRQELEQELGVNTTGQCRDAAKDADIVFLAVTPQVLGKILGDVAKVLVPGQLVVSIVGGFGLEDIEKQITGNPVVRVMPNTPAAVSAGMAGVVRGSKATAEQTELIADLFRRFGQAIIVGEELLEAVTAISGCGPAYVYVLIDAMADAGVRLGLTRQDALTLAAATFWGSGKMVLDSGEHPAKLRDMVCSPGGITIVGVNTMEERGVRGGFIRGIVSAYERSEEMTEGNK